MGASSDDTPPAFEARKGDAIQRCRWRIERGTAVYRSRRENSGPRVQSCLSNDDHDDVCTANVELCGPRTVGLGKPEDDPIFGLRRRGAGSVAAGTIGGDRYPAEMHDPEMVLVVVGPPQTRVERVGALPDAVALTTIAELSLLYVASIFEIRHLLPRDRLVLDLGSGHGVLGDVGRPDILNDRS